MKNLLLLIQVAFWTFSCRTGMEPMDKTVISVSIIPQQHFIEQLAGDLVEINVLIPPGASPATYEPSVSQLGKLERSAVYMRIGKIGFEESWMDKISSVNPDMKIVDLSKGVQFIEEDGGEMEVPNGHTHRGADPHIWMSTSNARIIARNIYQELRLLFPGEEEYLLSRFNQFSFSIDSLQQVISGKLEGMDNRKFLIYHPALTYYARDFGLEQYPLEIEGKTPSPTHLRQMTDLAHDHHISKIFIQSQFDRRNAEVLSIETGAEIIQFNPLDLHWSEQMSYIAEQLNPIHE